MAWNRRYSAISYVKSALWIVPVLALVIEMVTKRLVEHLGTGKISQGFADPQTGFFAVNAAEAHAILDRIFTVNLTGWCHLSPWQIGHCVGGKPARAGGRGAAPRWCPGLRGAGG